MKSRSCLIDDIKCLETQLSALQERFDIIVNWIQSQYCDLNGLPTIVIVAVRGDKGSFKEKLESTRETFPLDDIEHVKLECDKFDDYSDVNMDYKIESDDPRESSVDKMDVDVLEDIEFDPVSRKLEVVTVGDRPEGGDINCKDEQLNEDNSSVSDKTETHAHRGTRVVVKKTPRHLQINKDKGMIVTAIEYKEMIASLPIDRLSCAVCGKEFPTTHRLRRHEIEVHLEKEEGLKCRIDLQKSREEMPKAPRYVKKRNVKFLTAIEYKELVDSLPKKRLVCAICGKVCPNSTQSRRHEIEVHLTKEERQKYRSNFTKASEDGTRKNDKRTDGEKKLILTAFEYKEMIASLPKERLSCAICGKEYPSLASVRRHETEVHLTKEEKQKYRSSTSDIHKPADDVATMCDICNFPFKNIEWHKKNHLPPGVTTAVEGSYRPHYRCLKCDSLFSKKQTYLSHAMTECKVEGTPENSNNDQPTDEPEKNFLCNQCGQSFNRKYTLKVHELAVHANKRDFKCQYCDKRFVIEYRRKLHEKKHLGTLSVTCDLCGFSFRGKQVLKKHIRGVHENRRPHKCPFCEKSFKTSTARNYHINTHGNPNGRQRSLNRNVDPMHAAKKRRDGIPRLSMQQAQK